MGRDTIKAVGVNVGTCVCVIIHQLTGSMPEGTLDVLFVFFLRAFHAHLNPEA